MNPSLVLPLSRLRPALTGFGKIIGRRPSLAVLGHVQVRRHRDGAIDLTVTDLERTATCHLPSPDSEGGTAAHDPVTLLLPLEDLQNIARSAGVSDSIQVDLEQPDRAVLRFHMAGQQVAHPCDLTPADEFPSPPEMQNAEALPVTDALRQAIADALTCASSDATRYILNGVCLDVSRAEAHYVVATDGRHLFSANSFQLPLKNSLVLPDHKFLHWRGFTEDGAWTLRAGSVPNHNAPLIELASEHWRFRFRGIDGNYPNWRQVVPGASTFTRAVTVDPERLDALQRLLQGLPVESSNTNHLIGLELHEGALHLLGRSRADQEWNRIRVEATTVNGPDLIVFVNRDFVLKAIRLGLNRIEMSDERSPLRFSCEGRQMIVMPLRPGSDAAGTSADKPSPQPESTQACTANPPPNETPMPKLTHPPETTLPATATPGSARPNGHVLKTDRTESTESKPALETALDQVDQLRASVRGLLANLTQLNDSLRQALRDQRTGDKDLQNLRHTLRSLQSVRI